ncbi:MAG: NAD-dependent epimerase/dehydratase family protein, partial [Deltaproteobacteria bacterium]
EHYNVDIRDYDKLSEIFTKYSSDIDIVIHTAAQPSHDWAAKEPLTDFGVNALGTMNLLEVTRLNCPKATFIFTSTNKVYGDTPNFLPLIETKNRWEVDPKHPYSDFGIDENMSIDHSKHSLFGASKVAADVLVQEYGRYFGMKTGVFRGGCLTGPMHSGAELHGFLAYLVHCGVSGKPYNIYGYKGKQVRDNIHSHDLVNAFWHFSKNPKLSAVYNIGGSRHSNCSVLEAIEKIEKLTGRNLKYQVVDQNRSGDHIWWISDVRKFQKDYPEWNYHYNIDTILEEMIALSSESLKRKVA